MSALACGEPPKKDPGKGGGDGDSGMQVGDGDIDDDGYDDDEDDGTGDGDMRQDAGGGKTAVCGNGKFEEGELCDDHNTADGDGCNATCTAIDPDFLCLNAGEPCTRVVTCGNGIIEGDEVCDDGEMPPKDGDGCSATCKATEVGFTCVKPGEACIPSPVCGNGVRERGEQCDDGQNPPASDDGCSATCQIEDATAWFCIPGKACVARVCGDGNRTPDEDCDDGQNPPKSGDGCDATCKLEPGWRCGSSGCRPICGDGLLNGNEECDDGDLASGDGCSAACKEEPFYTCPGVAGDCTSNIVCGDGCVDPGEICDPGNLSNKCGQADASCVSTAADPAKACKAFVIASDPGVCGDGTVNLNEQCDPKCSGAKPCNIPGCTGCKVDTGWSCPKPGYCFQIPACNDGVIQVGEQCDPGAISTPGCVNCKITTNYYCSGEPSTCTPSVCGDGTRAPNEQCDDGGKAGGDGCSATCTVESGYVCPPGLKCKPVCGNGTLQPGEQCDDGNNTVGDGCNNCFIEAGWDCDANGKNCARTKCGSANGASTPKVERGEGCDDGNNIAGDGCSPTCQKEPKFTHDSSGKPTNNTASCGDGFKTQSEDCDDGNTVNGDGCSSACKEEPGWVCDENTLDYPPTIPFKVTYRDFKASRDAGGHRHFRRSNTGTDADVAVTYDRGFVGALCSTSNYDGTAEENKCGILNQYGVPQLVRASTTAPGSGANAAARLADAKNAFQLWYLDPTKNTPAATYATSSGMNVCVNPGPYTNATTCNTATTPDTILLTRDPNNQARYTFGSNSFFPLDPTDPPGNRGYGDTPGESNNFNFTTELRYFFQYKGGEVLTFVGDDDVWVFINGRLAVDVGGIHCAHKGRVVLGDRDGSCNVQSGDNSCSSNTDAPAACTTYTQTEQGYATDTRFGITKGEVYEIVLFHAERNPTRSYFHLTLDGFLAPRSTCKTVCGDGIPAGNELCDTKSSATSGYNVCLNNCSINFCGDGKVQSPQETCDDATKVTYRQTAGGCGFDCRPAPYCGDGVVQAFAGEVCDDGVNSGAYGSCASDCKSFAGYCGDGKKNGSEFCDSATKVDYQLAAGGCGFDCQEAPHCGDGVRNGTETCEPPNTAQCDATCQIKPFCGDGIKSPNEACDYGKFNAPVSSVDYGGCDVSCNLGPHCGDEETQAAAGEECDDGTGNSPAANPDYDTCTTACLLGPRCGDGIVQSAREACDNGFNEDTYAYTPDACGPDCTAVPYCGDGIVDPALEQCDDGTANSDGSYNGCRSDCQWGPYCGDGIQNGNEECDDPNGNVAYSRDGTGCSYECTLNVPSCGDGVRNGPEQCDNGKAGNDGLYGSCNADCTRAPRCGDNIVQAEHEECDDGPTGSVDCTQACEWAIILL